MLLFFFVLSVISYSNITPDVCPLAFCSGSIAIQYASCHFQNQYVPTPLCSKNRVEKNLFPWKQKTYAIWKLEQSDTDPTRTKNRRPIRHKSWRSAIAIRYNGNMPLHAFQGRFVIVRQGHKHLSIKKPLQTP